MSELPPLVSSGWLARHLDDVAVADVRWYLDGRSGRAAYESGHLPGAVFVDIDTDLAGPGAPTEGRHPLPTPQAFAGAMGRLGLADDRAVVAYDDSGGGTAGRLVWLLRVLGRPAAMLDGGLAAWEGELEAGPGAAPQAVTVPVVPWPSEHFATADEVASAATSGAAVVLDSRAADRYRGDSEPIDPRAGHVPGARNAPWSANLDPATGHFADLASQQRRFAALGVDEHVEVIAYCGSGVSACANLLALEALGLRARLYAPSWSGWSADADRPVATGEG